jgi:predicted deacetylase
VAVRARYLIRFDDLCPTMRWEVWDEVEATLVEHDVRPLLAVIPDNRDDTLRLEPPRADFWERVRGWQGRGWTIGLHGYQHRYVSTDRGLFGWDHRSEFAGLPVEEQREKIDRGLAAFRRHGVRPQAWVAPNHSFDTATLGVLGEAGMDVISDGLALHPYRDRNGMLWIPQQLWWFRPRSMGLWTVCLHPNTWGGREVERFRRDLDRYASRTTDLPSIEDRFGGRRRGPFDVALAGGRRLRKGIRGSLRGSGERASGTGMEPAGSAGR